MPRMNVLSEENLNTAMKEISQKVNEKLERGRMLNMRESVQRMENWIRGLQTRGYSLMEIAALLKEHGIDMSWRTMQQYLLDFANEHRMSRASALQARPGGPNAPHPAVPRAEGGLPLTKIPGTLALSPGPEDR